MKSKDICSLFSTEAGSIYCIFFSNSALCLCIVNKIDHCKVTGRIWSKVFRQGRFWKNAHTLVEVNSSPLCEQDASFYSWGEDCPRLPEQPVQLYLKVKLQRATSAMEGSYFQQPHTIHLLTAVRDSSLLFTRAYGWSDLPPQDILVLTAFLDIHHYCLWCLSYALQVGWTGFISTRLLATDYWDLQQHLLGFHVTIW